MSEKPLTGAYVNLWKQVLAYVTEEMADIPGQAIGDSPIEKVLHAALIALSRFCDAEFSSIELVTKDRPLSLLLSFQNPRALIVQPQAQLDGWRVDFFLYAWEFGRVSGRAQYRKCIVECDGHDFHERTKTQAAKDRGRDAEFQTLGYTVLRFTGSQIHNDPIGCARRVADWVAMGW